MALRLVSPRRCHGPIMMAASLQRRAFTSAPSGYATIRDAATPLPDAAVLSVSGADALKFLQGLTTNNMHQQAQAQAPDQAGATYTAFLNSKGRFLFDAFVVADKFRRSGPDTPDAFLLQTNMRMVPELLAHFNTYKLRSRVKFEDVTQQYAVWCAMSSDDKSLRQVVKENAAQPDSIAFVDPRVHRLGARFIVPRFLAPLIPDAYEYTTPEYYHTLRMFYGVPDGAYDFEYESTLPLEFNLDWLNGVSYTKGCYMGQELISRTHHKGVIRKRLMPLLLSPLKDEEKSMSAPSENSVLESARAMRVDHESLKADTTNSSLPRKVWSDRLLFPPTSTALLNPQFNAKRLAPSHPLGQGTQIFALNNKSAGKLSSSPMYNLALATVRLEYAFSPPSILRTKEHETQLNGVGFRVQPFVPYWWPRDFDALKELQSISVQSSTDAAAHAAAAASSSSAVSASADA